MIVEDIIDKYYHDNPKCRETLIVHSRQVAQFALEICDAHPELHLDREFVSEAAMLHDIGIVRCDAPSIHCFGTEPYIRHGVVGGEMLRNEGLPHHARVAERHTGTGLTIEQIREQKLPLPEKDFSPETMEEQVICYADKFFSKTKLGQRKEYDKVVRSLERFGQQGLERFERWHKMFAI